MAIDERYVLAVDSGGTKCDAVLARPDGTLLSRVHLNGSSSTASRSNFGSGRSTDTISEAITRALGDVTARELHVIGISPKLPVVLDIIMSRAAVVKRYHSHEGDPAFALCGVDYGITLVAGTGAIAQAKSPDGRFFHLDGLGPNLGDHGGAYNIGLQAVRAIGRFDWHPRFTNGLVLPICRALGLPDDPPQTGHLLHFMVRPHDRSVVAGLARVVDAVARTGDATARRILQEAAAGLAETVCTIAEQAGMDADPYPVIGSGSVAMHSDIYWDAFCARLRAYRPNLRPMRSPASPVLGTALIALQRLRAADRDTLLRNLLASEQALRENG